jgi:hypothetical protein
MYVVPAPLVKDSKEEERKPSITVAASLRCRQTASSSLSAVCPDAPNHFLVVTAYMQVEVLHAPNIWYTTVPRQTLRT